MSTPTSGAHEAGSEQVHLQHDDAATSESTTVKAGNSARHGAGLFDIRNIIGALMAIYGVILIVTSFTTSTSERAKADGANLNLWTGLGLLVLAGALIGWAVLRPIVVDERELAEDKAVAEQKGHPTAH